MVCALTTFAVAAHAQTAPATNPDLPSQAVALTDLSAFRGPTASWKIVGDASTQGERAVSLTTSPGTGVLAHLSSGARTALTTTWDHGDIDLSFDVMSSHGSKMSVFLMGRYGVALSDSWVPGAPGMSTIGAIAPRDARGSTSETYEGTLPRQNAGRAPGLWQHVDLIFRAPRYTGGQKVSSARFAKVTVNGVVVQENVQATWPIRGMATSEEGAGPLTFEGDGAFAIRNIRYKAYANSVALSGLRYRIYEGDAMDASYASTHAPAREGSATSISPDLQVPQDKFAVTYNGSFTAPTAGKYRFALSLGWIGNDSATRGPAIGGGMLTIDDRTVVLHAGAARRSYGDVDLSSGAHAFAVTYYKNRPQFNRRDVSITVEGPGVERRSLSDDNAGLGGGGFAPTDPIMVEPQAEPVVLRSFVRHRNTKRVYVASVADPRGVHYSYDLAQGSLLYVWRGPFLETTQMWHERGEDQTADPMGSVVQLDGTPSVAHFNLPGAAAWPDSLDDRQLHRDGYALDKTGHPTFLYRVNGVSVEDAVRADPDGLTLRRELRFHATSTAESEGLCVQLAQAEHIARQADGLYVIGDRSYYIRMPASAARPTVRRVAGRDELLVPVRFYGGEATVSYSIVW